jgi:hypothetical protein
MLRLAFATFAAATFGNILFHFFLTMPIIMASGLIVALKGSVSFVFYAVLLGISIVLSQRRQISRRAPPGQWERRLSPVLVLGFFAILSLFNQPYQAESIMVNFRFFRGLF